MRRLLWFGATCVVLLVCGLILDFRIMWLVVPVGIVLLMLVGP
jgi:hypothetical protein